MMQVTENLNILDFVNPFLSGSINEMAVRKVLEKEAKYQVGEIVDIANWVDLKKDFEVVDIKVTYHPRLDVWCYGYKVFKKDDETGLNFEYIPEGYLRKKE